MEKQASCRGNSGLHLKKNSFTRIAEAKPDRTPERTEEIEAMERSMVSQTTKTSPFSC